MSSKVFPLYKYQNEMVNWSSSKIYCQNIINGYQLYQQTAREPQMGKKIQNYILESAVGSGEFGKVYKAYNEKTGQVVAIKVIQIQKFRSSPKLQEFTINEINTLSKIQDSTHIVRFIEILKTANNYYFVYEFCNQGTLEQKIKSEGKFTQEKALLYFNELLSAFKMLVKNNIMHRDIKPSNILLNNGVIKLADFGFCKPMKDSKDLAQTMLGSPIYMAPEILKGQIYTMKADIWSLGVVLYEMLYGFCPFEERSIARLINLIDEGTVSFPSSVKTSKHTEDLIKRMLVKDQFKRIQWRQLFEYNLFPKEHTKNQLNENSRHSISYFEETKSHKNNSNSKKEAPTGLTNNTGLTQQSPQQTIVNPFTKKHFQSVNTNIQVNDFNNHHQVSTSSNNGALDQRQKQQDSRYGDPVKQDYSNRNTSSNKKYLNHGSSIQQNNQKLIAERGISQQKQRKRSNTVHDIREATNQKEKEHILQYQSNSHTIIQNLPIPSQISMKKTRSTPVNNVSDVEKKIIQNILEKRQKIVKGIKMVQKFLSQSSTKANMSICCFIAKKVKSLALETEETIRKSLKEREYKNKEKENSQMTSSNIEIDKAITSILDEIKQIKVKLEPFEYELAQIHEPQDIIFLRYGEEEKLTQEKEGLSQLLMIDDFLNISISAKNNMTPGMNQGYGNQSGTLGGRVALAPVNKETQSFSILCSMEQNYQARTKKELLEEYEKRVLRNI